MAHEETDLILRAQTGDHRAFCLLIQRYDEGILRLACEVAGSPEDGKDICQEALVAAYRALPGFRMQSSFYTWLYRIAINKALKFRRSRSSIASLRRHGASPVDAERDVGDIPAPDATPEDRLLDRELSDEIASAQAALSPRERTAFVLCHREGHAISKAAELMGCSDGAIKSYLFRARDKMKRSLRAYLEG